MYLKPLTHYPVYKQISIMSYPTTLPAEEVPHLSPPKHEEMRGEQELDTSNQTPTSIHTPEP